MGYEWDFRILILFNCFRLAFSLISCPLSIMLCLFVRCCLTCSLSTFQPLGISLATQQKPDGIGKASEIIFLGLFSECTVRGCSSHGFPLRTSRECEKHSMLTCSIDDSSESRLDSSLVGTHSHKTNEVFKVEHREH